MQATEYSGSNTTKTCFYELCTFIRTPLVITAEYMEINLTIIYLVKHSNVYYLSSKYIIRAHGFIGIRVLSSIAIE